MKHHGATESSNTLYTGDNLYILHGINSESMDLIYLDPPFNSKRMYEAPVGSKAAGTSFKDMWTWSDVDEAYLEKIIEEYPFLVQFIQSVVIIHSKAMMSYVTYMAQRILEMHRLLKPNGTLYLHCDQTASHYLKIVLDRIFGKDNYLNEIIWQRASGRAKGSQHEARTLGTDVDVIFHYAKSKDYTHHAIYKALSPEEIAQKFPHQDSKGAYNTGVPLFRQPSMGARPNLCYEYKGVTNPHPSGWRVKKERLVELDDAGSIIWREGKRPLRKSYAKDYKGKPIGNLWMDIPIAAGKERTGYPTQKPLALMRRIIQASSNDGDLVLDPFCGCATTCVAAQQLHRKWIGIDISSKSADLVAERLADDAGLFKNFIHWKDSNPPVRTDIESVAYTPTVKEQLYQQQDEKCNACGLDVDARHLELDHIIPKSKGGGNYYDNYQLLCGNCNRVKGNRPMEYLRAKIKKRNDVMKFKVSFGN